MIRRLLTVLVAAALATLVGVTPAHATDGPTVSDRPPISRSTGQQAAPTGAADNRSLSPSSVDAANTYLYRDWNVKAGSFYKSLAVTQVMQGPNDAAGYFYAESYYFVGGSDFGGYVGVQTHLFQPGGDVGHGAIASIWGATGASPVAGATAVHGTEAGQDFWSLHLPWNWGAGHYLRYYVMSGYNGTPSNVVTFFVEDISSVYHDKHFLGTITVPPTWGGLTGRTIDWIEEYAPSAYASCAAIPDTYDIVKGGDAVLWSGTTGSAYITTSTGAIQSGTGCSNSVVYPVGSPYGTQSFQQYIGT